MNKSCLASVVARASRPCVAIAAAASKTRNTQAGRLCHYRGVFRLTVGGGK
jgi:hypothetical protein